MAFEAVLTTLRTFLEDGEGDEEESWTWLAAMFATCTTCPIVEKVHHVQLFHLRDFRCSHQTRVPSRGVYTRHTHPIPCPIQLKCSHIWPRLHRPNGPCSGPDSPKALCSLCRHRTPKLNRRHRRPSTFSFFPYPSTIF